MFAHYVIDAITNGVHAATWTSAPFQTLFDRYIPGWREDNFSLRYALSIPNHEVWDAHLTAKHLMLQHVNHATQAGMEVDVLTVGFARRATAYKRMDLLFQDVERLKHLNRGAAITTGKEAHMPHISWKTTGLFLVLTTALVGGVHAQRQHEQHHPGGAQTPQQQPAETSPGVPAPPRRMQGMMENMQGMMQHMQGMMERMQGMMGRQGMGMTTQEEDDEEESDEAASPQRTMMGHRDMMGLGGMRGPGGMTARHMARLAQQLELTDEQRAQIRMLMRNHAKEALRLRADIGVLTVDIQQVLDTDPVDLPKAKQLFQSMAMKEADLHLVHVTLMQEVAKLLTPDQQKKFRTMRVHVMGMGRMMGHEGMLGRGHGER
jgi:Spy/CpxP family protein refolding chaperone